jgi:predicted DNA-binding helix-hairpin-helix protein
MLSQPHSKTLVLFLVSCLSIPALGAEPVDINHATQRELMSVPGITQVWAQRIIRFRPYRTKRDLLDKGVVSATVYYKVRDCIIAHRDLH